MCVLGDLERLATKFIDLARENQMLPEDLQQVNVYKAHRHEELTKRFHRVEVTLVTSWQQALGVPSLPKDPTISPLTKFDGNNTNVRGFLNLLHQVLQMDPTQYPTNSVQLGLDGTLLTNIMLT